MNSPMEKSEHNVVAGSNGRRFTETNEAGLLAVAKCGETAAFELLYRAYAKRILHTVRRITRNREDAEDAVQEAFLSAFLHIQTFDGRSAFSTWLTRIGINSALMMLRKKRNSREITAAKDSQGESPWEATDSRPDPEQQYAEQERWGLVRGVIAGLRPSIRRALEMHTLQSRSVEEMASEIGISVCAAKGRLFHARKALRKSKVLRKIGDRHRRRQFSNLQHQLEPEKRGRQDEIEIYTVETEPRVRPWDLGRRFVL
jgi:RNA polymerase sigma factor (sigma-70 family)